MPEPSKEPATLPVATWRKPPSGRLRQTRTEQFTPRVSIGMPVYNGAAFLSRAIESILAQSFDNLELIISDNDSTDNTRDICLAFAAKDSRIRFYRNASNLGATANYNLVFELATGEYFKWASHDDICGPQYLEKTVEVLASDPAIVACYSRTSLIDEDENIIGLFDDGLDLRSESPARRFEGLFRACGRWHPVFGLIRTSALGSTALIGNYQASDRILVAELALRGQIHEIPEYLFFRRIHPQMSGLAYSSREAQAVWCDPRRRGKLAFPRWRWLREYVRAVNHAPISKAERLTCYCQLARWVRWTSSDMAADLRHAAYDLVDGLTRPHASPESTQVQ